MASTRTDAVGITSVQKRRNLHWMKQPVFVDTLDSALNQPEPAVYVCGAGVPDFHQLAALAAAGWNVSADGQTPTLRREGRTVRWIQPWTGRPTTAIEAGHWWNEFAPGLAKVAAGARPFGSPGTTGRDVWLRLIPATAEYPVMTPALREFVRGIAGQGRVQIMIDRTEDGTIPALYESDSRLAYLGCMSNMPIGEPDIIHNGHDVERWLTQYPYGQAFVECDWHAPRFWKHPGIMPMRRDDAPAWPLDGRGWVHASTLALARQYNWNVTCAGAIVWTRSGEPFRGFKAAIAAGMAMTHSCMPDLWRSSWRAIALHTIGAMFAAPRKTTHFLPESDADIIPDDAENVQVLPAGKGSIVRYTTLDQAAWPETHHPEWSATIWARARNRLLEVRGVDGVRVGALHLPPENIVGFRTDAIYTTAAPGWDDDGAIGRYRIKRGVMGPFAWPTTQSELLGSFDGPVAP